MFKLRKICYLFKVMVHFILSSVAFGKRPVRKWRRKSANATQCDVSKTLTHHLVCLWTFSTWDRHKLTMNRFFWVLIVYPVPDISYSFGQQSSIVEQKLLRKHQWATLLVWTTWSFIVSTYYEPTCCNLFLHISLLLMISDNYIYFFCLSDILWENST